MIDFDCPQCHGHFSVPENLAGRRARCKKCATPLTIPRLAPPPPLELEPAPALQVPASVASVETVESVASVTSVASVESVPSAAAPAPAAPTAPVAPAIEPPKQPVRLPPRIRR